MTGNEVESSSCVAATLFPVPFAPTIRMRSSTRIGRIVHPIGYHSPFLGKILFRVFAGIRKKEFTVKRKDFDSLGEAWFNMSVQFPFVSKLLIILTPMFALGELMEKFATILELKIGFKRKPKEDFPQEGAVVPNGMYDSANSR